MDNTGGRFRKKRTNFSIVSNNIIRDENISLKAKGLYALIQSYITIDNFTLYKGFLQAKCSEGKKAFESAWKELKDSGYLVQYRLQDEESKKFIWEYDLLEEPKKPYTQKGGNGYPSPQKGYDGKGIAWQKDDMENGAINNVLPNNVLHTNSNPINIISENDVREQIDYGAIQESDKPIADNLVSIMVDVLNMDDEKIIRVNQIDTAAREVKKRYRKINYSHIQYIILVLKDFTGKINKLRNYIITTIYNAPTTLDIYFQNRVQHDMHKE